MSRFVLASTFCVEIVPTAGWSQAASDSTRLDELARAAARQFSESRVEEGQTRPNVLAQTATPNVELTLDEATARSLERNLDIASRAPTRSSRISTSPGCAPPTGPPPARPSATVRSCVPPTNQLNGGNIVQNDTSTYNAGITQVLPWTVTSRSSSTTTSRSPRTSSPTSTRPIRRTSTLRSASRCCATSPSTARQRLRVTAINREISDIQLRGTIATTLANVRNSYWELVFAVQAVDVARGSLDRPEAGGRQPGTGRGRHAGAMDVVQAEAEAATRRQALAQAEATLGTAELALKRLIVNGADDHWRARITPVDRPEFRSEALEVEGAVRQRSASGPISSRRGDGSTATTSRSLCPAEPDAAGAGRHRHLCRAGLGGTQFIRQGTGLGSTVIGTIRSATPTRGTRWSSAISHLERPAERHLPAGRQRAREASFARARVQRTQSVAQLRALGLSVATEVTNAALQVDFSLKRYEAATVAREARPDVSRPSRPVSTWASPRTSSSCRRSAISPSQNSELRALLDYRRAVVDFERVQQAPANRGGGIRGDPAWRWRWFPGQCARPANARARRSLEGESVPQAHEKACRCSARDRSAAPITWDISAVVGIAGERRGDGRSSRVRAAEAGVAAGRRGWRRLRRVPGRRRQLRSTAADDRGAHQGGSRVDLQPDPRRREPDR